MHASGSVPDEVDQNKTDPILDEGEIGESHYHRRIALFQLRLPELKEICAKLKIAKYGAKDTVIGRIIDAEDNVTAHDADKIAATKGNIITFGSINHF